MDWFLYDIGLCHERVKHHLSIYQQLFLMITKNFRSIFSQSFTRTGSLDIQSFQFVTINEVKKSISGGL